MSMLLPAIPKAGDEDPQHLKYSIVQNRIFLCQIFQYGIVGVRLVWSSLVWLHPAYVSRVY